jgi:acyl dehydratase
MNQPYFEDVEPGDEIGPLVKQPSREEVTAFAKVSRLGGRFTSDEAAHGEGYDTWILSAWQSMGYLAQVITNWMGQDGSLSKFQVFFRRVVGPGDLLECRAIVTDKITSDGHNRVVMDAFMENQNGEHLIQGTAEVVLPSRTSSTDPEA